MAHMLKNKTTIIILAIFLTIALLTGLFFTKNPSVDANSNDKAPVLQSTNVNSLNKAKIEDFDSWRLVCQNVNSNSSKQCRIFQNLVNKGGKKLLLSAVIVMTEKDQKPVSLMRLVTPKGISIPVGVIVRVDEEQQITIPFQTCLPMGCVAEITLNDKMLSSMKLGSKMAVAYQIIGIKPFIVNLSLKGFTGAYKNLKKKTLEAEN